MSPEALRAYRVHLRAEGICIHCLLAPVKAGRRLCQGCIDKSLSRLRRLRAEWVAAGRCRDCGGSLETEAYCARCMRMHRRCSKAWEQRMRVRGRCVQCGCPIRGEVRATCVVCAETKYQAKRQWSACDG